MTAQLAAREIGVGLTGSAKTKRAKTPNDLLVSLVNISSCPLDAQGSIPWQVATEPRALPGKV